MDDCSVVYFDRRKGPIEITFPNRRIAERRTAFRSPDLERRRSASQIRHHKRELVKVPVQIQAKEAEITGLAENISVGGLMALAKLVLDPGTSIVLKIPVGEDFCHLNISGQVIFCRPAEGSVDQYAVGIRFFEIPEFEKQMLALALQKLKQSGVREGDPDVYFEEDLSANNSILIDPMNPISGIQDKLSGIVLRQEADYNLRPLRFVADELKDLKVAVFFTEHERSNKGVLLNFSKYGVSFETGSDEISLNAGDILGGFEIKVADQILYSGNAIVVYLDRSARDGIRLGVSFPYDTLDVEKIFGLRKRSEVESDFDQFLSGLEIINKVESEFKANVADLRYLLEGIKETLDKEESKVKSRGIEGQNGYEKDILDAAYQKTKGYLDRFLKRMARLVKDLPLEKRDSYKRYFQRHLHGLLLMSPFGQRIYSKPRGYAGDYQAINMILRNADEGGSLFAKLLSRHACNLPLAQAHRNRIDYLVGKLNSLVETRLRTAQRANVATIGCGPSAEVVEFIRTNPKSNQCEFTLIDFDPEPLYFSHRKIAEARAQTQSAVRINLLNKSLKDFIRGEKSGKPLIPKQDFIYCTGLFDYLSFSLCVRMTQILFDYLSEGGVLIISNVADLHDFQMYMEYGVEWYLKYRSKEELKEFSKGLPSSNVWLESDETRLNHFLLIQK